MRSDDIVLTHKTDKDAVKLFFYYDGVGGECKRQAHEALYEMGMNNWWLTVRPYTWTPQEAEGLAS